MSFLKNNIGLLAEYKVPQMLSCTKLNQNESPYDIPEELKNHIFKVLKARAWNRYPQDECQPLLNGLARYVDLPVSSIMVGNSSNELIQTVIYATCNSGDAILVVRPTFSVYQRVADIMNVRVDEVPLNQDFSFNTESIMQKSQGVKVVILASPNNPTGTVMPLDGLRRRAQAFTGLLVVDEAYFEFYGQSAKTLLKDFNNIVVLRTFSKAMSLAGLRLGYLFGQPEVVRHLKKVKLPFSVGLFQQVVGEALLANRAFFETNIKRIINDRECMFKNLQRIPGINPIPSQTNFILFHSAHIQAKTLFEKLLQRGVLVRHFSSLEMREYLRVNVGTREENAIFQKNLEDTVEEMSR